MRNLTTQEKTRKLLHLAQNVANATQSLKEAPNDDLLFGTLTTLDDVYRLALSIKDDLRGGKND